MQGNIVLVGAGGAGLSNLVGILWDLGFKNIVGVDGQVSQITQQLQKKGIQIFSHGVYPVKTEDIVIYSSATEKSVEVQTAFQLKKERHAPLLIRDYFEFLGEMSKYFQTVGFTGTNGKSSSSAMGIATARKILPDFGIGIVGALVPDFGGGSYSMGKDQEALKNIFTSIFTGRKLDYDLVKKFYFFLEACEYQRHFLHLDLDYAIITNLELEHTDYFKDWNDYESAFLELVDKLKKKVFVLGHLASEKILRHPKAVIVEKQHFDFTTIWGEHQQENASLVYGLLERIKGEEEERIKGSRDASLMCPSRDASLMRPGRDAPVVRPIDEEGGDASLMRPDAEGRGGMHPVKQGLEHFRGIRRRMEYLSRTGKGAQIFSDYGHVASSLEVGLKALREKFPEKRLTCIFQPHQMHRILQGWNEFPQALAGYDEHYIYDIYAARENVQKIAEDFGRFQKVIGTGLESVRQHPTSIGELGEVFAQHCGSRYLKTFDEIETIIEKAETNEIIVVYSAGDVDYELRKYLGVVS